MFGGNQGSEKLTRYQNLGTHHFSANNSDDVLSNIWWRISTTYRLLDNDLYMNLSLK